MTKTFLLAATALTALIATSAQAQIAIDISNVDGTAFNAIEIDDYTLADEIDWSAGVDVDLEFAIVPSTSAVLPSGNAKLDITITGAVFGEQVTAASVLKDVAACDPTRSVISGGGAGQSTVSFLLSDLTACNNGAPIEIDLPVELVGTDVDLEINFRTEAGTGIDGQFADIEGVVSFASAFDVVIDDNDGFETVADVSVDPVYTALLVGPDYSTELGDVTLAVDTDVFVDIYGGGLNGEPADFSDIADYDVTVTADTGSFFGLDMDIDGAAVIDVDDETATDTINPTSNTESDDIDVSADGDEIEGATFSVLVEVDYVDADLTDEDFTGDINPVTLGGTNFLAPWLAINNPNNSSTVRVSNGGDATGPVILTLQSASDGSAVQTCDMADLAELASIPANGRIEIDVADLRTCFGTDVANGDVRFTIQGSEDELTAKARLRSVTGVVVETSLGRLTETDEAY